MSMQVYLDNAATTPIEPAVLESMYEVMKNCFGNPSSIHAMGRKAKTLLEGARKDVAKVLNASTGEIFFTSSATESNNTAIYCTVRDLGISRIVTSPTEHPCVLNTVEFVTSQHGCGVEYLPVDSRGNTDLDRLRTVLSDGTPTLVSLMHGNNEIGTISEIETLSEICAEYGALLHCDTVQTIGKIPIDLSQLRIHFLSGSGHKIYGPKGVGFLYVNSDVQIHPLIRGGGQERRMRSGTENIYGIVGLSKALSWLNENRKEHIDKVTRLRSYMKKRLSEKIPEVAFNGNQDKLFLPNILNLSIPRDEKSELVIFSLDINGICASAGSACSSGAEQASHVIQAIGMPETRKAIRFSFSHHNTFEELDYTVDKLAEILHGS